MIVVELEETVFVIKQNENFRKLKAFDCQRMEKVYFGLFLVLLAISFNFDSTLDTEGSLVEKWLLRNGYILSLESFILGKIYDVGMLPKEQTWQCEINL